MKRLGQNQERSLLQAATEARDQVRMSAQGIAAVPELLEELVTAAGRGRVFTLWLELRGPQGYSLHYLVVVAADERRAREQFQQAFFSNLSDWHVVQDRVQIHSKLVPPPWLGPLAGWPTRLEVFWSNFV